ncbi:hypothetical protein A6A04_10490 [Paramagnetospirillum marisnigri]|uniref:Uncharacterized protein n=1 Tax=Paramagnetospirillum marisnigri TaxID=1285242 RepID=A0A178N077_9PROT|nr:hypothetical protein A6A04_10490 [Paramagnetospirillum marisnigri]
MAHNTARAPMVAAVTAPRAVRSGEVAGTDSGADDDMFSIFLADGSQEGPAPASGTAPKTFDIDYPIHGIFRRAYEVSVRK